MARIACLSVVFSLILAATAHAVVVEIPLPDLLGQYPAQRTTHFQLPAAPSVIHGASFRVAGVATLGTLDCDGVIYPYWAETIASMNDGGGFWMAGATIEADGTFSSTSSFESLFGATWGFLLDGTGAVTLYGNEVNTFCNELTPPAFTVTEATLIVDAEFPVTIQPSTWGKIKALYR